MLAVLSLNRDLAQIGALCKRKGMQVSPIKTKALVILRSGTLEPIYLILLLDGNVVERCDRIEGSWCRFGHKTVLQKSYQVDSCFCIQ